MSGLLLPDSRITVTAAAANGYLTVSSTSGLYVKTICWLTLTSGASPVQVEITEISGTSVGVRFVQSIGSGPNYGRSNVSAYNAGGYLYQNEQFLYRSGDIAALGILATGLEAYWKMDDGTDSTGNHNLTLSNITFAPGKIGNAANYNSITSTVIAPSLDILTNLTVSAWVYPTQHADYYTIAAHMIGGGWLDTNYHLIMLPAGDVALFGTGDTGITNSSIMPLNTWTHVVATRTTTGYTEMWTNGVKTNTGTGPAPHSVPAGLVYVGCRGDSYSYWQGAIDEVGIWSRVLPDDQIAMLYNAGSGISYPF